MGVISDPCTVAFTSVLIRLRSFVQFFLLPSLRCVMRRFTYATWLLRAGRRILGFHSHSHILLLSLFCDQTTCTIIITRICPHTGNSNVLAFLLLVQNSLGYPFLIPD